MTLKLTRPASLALLAMVSHACTAPGPQEMATPKPAVTAIHTGATTPRQLSADDTLPSPASFGELLESLSTSELQVFRWDQSPQVFVFIFPDLTAQALALNRIAAFVEKAHAPRDRVLSDAELSTLIQARGKTEQTYYVGHDYIAGALAAFFNAALSSGFQLNSQEQDLRSRLLQLGFFSESDNGQLLAQTPERVLLSVAPEHSPQLSAEVRRLKLASILRHELSHAEFFVNPAYREYCLQMWNGLPDFQRQIFIKEFARSGYDTSNTLLLANEFQAYLWEPEVGFLIDVRLRKQGSSLEKLRADFIAKLQSMNPAITTIFAIAGFDTPIVWWERAHTEPNGLTKRHFTFQESNAGG